MVTPLGWLERVPTYKEALENVKDKDLHTYGFLGYPTLQTADIVIYSAENTDLVVPVGEDQVSHVELSREIVRRLNNYWGRNLRQDAFGEKKKAAMRVVADVLGNELVPSPGTPYTTEQKAHLTQHIRDNVREVGLDNFAYPDELRELIEADVLVEPQVMLTQTPRIPGLDGRKMSKSYGNAITLSESDADIRAKAKVMVTDPARKRRTDPGNPDVCPVYDWHKLFSPPPTLEWAANGCRTAGIGCIECKSAMADNLIKWIEPIRERRIEHEKNPARVLEILNDGSSKARDQAQKTMSRVREAVFGWDSKRKEIFGAAGE
jgi:tryptophanyl-tRNA synthetase